MLLFLKNCKFFPKINTFDWIKWLFDSIWSCSYTDASFTFDILSNLLIYDTKCTLIGFLIVVSAEYAIDFHSETWFQFHYVCL
jgi:hypothetical protein